MVWYLGDNDNELKVLKSEENKNGKNKSCYWFFYYR